MKKGKLKMSNLNGCCKNCGEYYHGDGYTKVLHCPTQKMKS